MTWSITRTLAGVTRNGHTWELGIFESTYLACYPEGDK